MTLDGRTVLVTGSEGFIGRATVKSLLERSVPVVAYDLVPVANRQHHGGPRQPTAVSASVADADALERAARLHEVGAIVNLAGLIIPACRANPQLGAEINIGGHLAVFETARKLDINRLVYTSTVAARPRPPNDAPVNLYGVFKNCCENIARVYHLEYGLASVGLRPNVVYGPGREIGETAFVSQAMTAAVQGHPFAMPFSGEMCFQHIDEVVDVIIRCLDAQPSEAVISDITTRTHSVDEVIAAIRAVVPDADLSPSTVLRPAPDTLDSTALRDLLGPWPEISLHDGTRRTIDALRHAPGQT